MKHEQKLENTMDAYTQAAAGDEKVKADSVRVHGTHIPINTRLQNGERSLEMSLPYNSSDMIF